jgi:hypothetical protein
LCLAFSLDLLILLVLNATFNSISAISWRPVLEVEEAGVPGEIPQKHPVVIFDCIVDHYFLNVHRDVSRIDWVDRDVGCVVDWLYYGTFL